MTKFGSDNCLGFDEVTIWRPLKLKERSKLPKSAIEKLSILIPRHGVDLDQRVRYCLIMLRELMQLCG